MTAGLLDPDPNEGFFLDIDEAIKDKVDNAIHVTDKKAGAEGRLVRAFYRWPQVEVTDQTFPFITIDLLRFERAAEREQRSGDPDIPYVPTNVEPPADGEFLHTEDMPIPYDFIYQITTHARFTQHDREMALRMIQNDIFPPRGAYLVVGDTVRDMFVEGPVDASGLDPQPGGRSKRHFRKVWTVTAHGELFQKDIELLSQPTSILIAASPTE